MGHEIGHYINRVEPIYTMYFMCIMHFNKYTHKSLI